MNGYGRPACHCVNQGHPPRFIVLTGGPGAGKTAVLELARRHFCEHVSLLPEAASIIFTGGFPRKDTAPAVKSAQRAIYHVQRELERIVEEEAKSAVAICDRGTMDGLAYWPESEESYWRNLGSSREREMARYDAVIHLRTPTAELGYNHRNPVRVEDARRAAEIDEKIYHAWEGHPRRFIIESTFEFLEKAEKTIAAIRGEIPTCCALAVSQGQV